MADRKPIKSASGILTEFGSGDTVAVANGGTGQTTLATAVEALLAALSATQGVIPYRASSAWAALAAGTAGQILYTGGAGANPSWGNVPAIGKYKTADESVTNSAALQNDDDLKFSIGANENWAFIMPIGLVCGASGGFKWAFTLPSGASGFGGNLIGTARLTSADLTTGSGETTASTTASNQPIIVGYVANSSTPGTVQFQFAQNATNGTATTVKKGSILIAVKI